MAGALATLLLSAAALTVEANPAPLNESTVREFITRFDAAERAGDVAAIGAALAADCRVEMRALADGHEHVTAMSHDEYLADLGDYYGSLHDLAGYEYRSEPAVVALVPGGLAADATRQIAEAFGIDGERLAFQVEETTRIERRDGRLVITALASRSRPE